MPNCEESIGFMTKLKRIAERTFLQFKIGTRQIEYCTADILRLNDRIYVVFGSELETRQKLANLFKRKQTVVCSFKEQPILHEIFRYKKIKKELSLSNAVEFVKGITSWFNIDHGNRIIMEYSYRHREIIIYYLSCLISTMKYSDNAISAFTDLNQIPDMQLEASPKLIRYCNYFDQVGNLEQSNQLIMSQIILTSMPTEFNEPFVPHLQVESNGKIEVFTDMNYEIGSESIVFANVNKIIRGETRFRVFYTKNNKKTVLFKLDIDAHFYCQGLVRFTCEDIEVEQSHITIPSDFYFDVVIIENNTIVESLLNMNLVAVENIRLFCNGISTKKTQAIYEKYINMGYNEHIAKIGSIMEYKTEEMCEISKKLKLKGYKNVKTSTKDNISSTNIDQEDVERDFKDVLVEISNKYRVVDDQDIKEVEVIKEREQPLPVKPKKLKFIKNEKAIEHTGEFIAKKPLRINPIKQVNGTVFDLKHKEIIIDFYRFEDQFCESKYDRISKSNTVKQNETIVDSRRLFFISLALKHLENSKIATTLTGIKEAVNTSGNHLTVENIHNICRIFPIQSEMELLIRNLNNLNPIETIMHKLGSNKQLKIELDILLFQRLFIEESESIKRHLNGLNNTLMEIMGNASIRSVFGILLEICNTINYEYSTQKKHVIGFRLSSISIFSQYRINNNTLIRFIREIIDENDISIDKINIDITKYKNVDLCGIKTAVNEKIVMYKENKKAFNQLPDETKIKYQSFFNYTQVQLHKTVELYKNTTENSIKFKRYFGENNLTELSDLFGVLDDFITVLKQND